MKTSRLVAAGTVAATAVLTLSAPAFAHVSVQPEGVAAKGSYAVVNFKVPNESDTAATTRVEVNLPADHPLASVMPQKIDGWTVKVTKSKLDKPVTAHGEKIGEAVTKVTWTADGKGIEPGFFQKFPLSIGALPEDTDSLVFKAVQTYSDKSVVRWIEPQKEGAEEPEHPAPTLVLSAATEGGHHGSAAAEDASHTEESAEHTDEAASAADGSDTTARVLGVVGIVVGLAGVAYGVLAGRRRTNA
ncbi:YcnI family copper-binding membrane protein [Streptomyces triticiradicis]|uniref:YcnI family protein n=1 Tax=Streptomyces triticiradicis TaxID=2651189 RepID=A0A7J5DCK9_9ACTN|nr:YcnI family protein [Streptomyces triticiradicis]KAB1986567.1 YcnI family protein [Streptomyces triticiradicis]